MGPSTTIATQYKHRTHTYTTQLQLTFLYRICKVTVKMGHAAVTLLITKGMSCTCITTAMTSIVVTFLIYKVMSYIYISLPPHESLYYKTLYLHIFALYRLANLLNELHNLLYQKPCVRSHRDVIIMSKSVACMIAQLCSFGTYAWNTKLSSHTHKLRSPGMMISQLPQRVFILLHLFKKNM